MELLLQKWIILRRHSSKFRSQIIHAGLVVSGNDISWLLIMEKSTRKISYSPFYSDTNKPP